MSNAYMNQGAKIIPFPGVSLETGDNFQSMLGDFLKEMGYIDDEEPPHKKLGSKTYNGINARAGERI